MDLTDPKTGNVWKSDAIDANASSNDMFWKIRGFFTDGNRAGSEIDVVRTMQDKDGKDTTDSGAATKYTYTVRLWKRIDGYSFTAYNTATFGNIASTIKINPPNSSKGKKSSTPLSGNFVLSCPDDKGVMHKLSEKDINEWEQGVQVAIDDEITMYRSKVWVTRDWHGERDDHWTYRYAQNGVSY